MACVSDGHMREARSVDTNKKVGAMTNEEQICFCQDPDYKKRNYLGWMSYAERLTRRGVKQHYCRYCKRYKFPGELCRLGRKSRKEKQKGR